MGIFRRYLIAGLLVWLPLAATFLVLRFIVGLLDNSLLLLPEKFHNKLLDKMKECYPMDYKIYWANCKYFWEGHPDLPSIDINELENIFSD